MIILAVGMPRAGSGWHYNLVKELMATAGFEDSRGIRERFRMQGILTAVNTNIGVLSFRRLLMVSVPGLLGKQFVIKAHSGPTIWIKFLINIGLFRVLYIYRDPRDAMLSAMDYGARVLEKQNRPNAFSHLTDVNKAAEFFAEYIRDQGAWQALPKVHSTRYEDFLLEYDREADAIVKFLGLERANPDIEQVIEKNRPGGNVQEKQGTHFFKGQVGRFRDRFTPEEIGMLNQRFGESIRKMGYPL